MAGSNYDGKPEQVTIMAMHYQLAAAARDGVITIQFTVREHAMQIIFVILTLAFLFLLGTFLIFYNLRPSNLAEKVGKGSREFYRSYGAYWRNHLLNWHVVDQQGDASAELKEVITSWELIDAPYGVATGITMVLYALSYSLLLWLSKGAILENTRLLFALWVVFWMGLVFGGSLGYAIGFKRAKQEGHRKVAYADLRQRYLSDYRSSEFRWLLRLFVTLNVVLLLVLPFLLGLQPPTYSDAWEGVIIVFVLFIVGEAFMTRIALMPRLVVTTDPTVAQRADDLLRALVIGEIHSKVLQGIGFLLFVQWFLLYRWLLSSPVFVAIQIIITVLWLLCFIPTSLRTRDKGRLGGRITGWPWSRMVSA